MARVIDPVAHPINPAAHGTPRGAQAHYARGEKPCRPCADAHAARNLDWKRRKRAGGGTGDRYNPDLDLEREDEL